MMAVGAAHPACPQCHGAAHLAVVRVEKHACVLPRERFNVCATPCVHMHTHTDTRLQPLWRNSPAVGGPAPGGDARGFPFSSRGGSSLRVPGPRSPSQGAEVTARAALPAGRIWAECHTMGSFSCSAALLPPRERERSPARPSPPPLPWGAMSHPPHLPAPTLPLALGHTCLLPRRTVLIWGTVGASLKGETLSGRPSAAASSLSKTHSTGGIRGACYTYSPDAQPSFREAHSWGVARPPRQHPGLSSCIPGP